MRKFRIVVDGTAYEVELEEIGGAVGPGQKAAAPGAQPVKEQDAAPERKPVSPPKDAAAQAPAPAGGDGVRVEAPMPGTILDIKVQVGDSVSAGQVMAILEAMKMENEITAPQDGIVKEVLAAKGAAVNSGDVLLVLS